MPLQLEKVLARFRSHLYLTLFFAGVLIAVLSDLKRSQEFFTRHSANLLLIIGLLLMLFSIWKWLLDRATIAVPPPPPAGGPDEGYIIATNHPLTIILLLYLVIFAIFSGFALLQLIMVDCNIIPQADAVQTLLAVVGLGERNCDRSNLWWLPAEIVLTPETHFMLLVIFSGFLGGLLKSLESYRNYVGERNLKGSWVPFYLVQPFIGVGLALIFYLVFRGGLFGDTDITSANPFGFIAISGLIGLFSEQAMSTLKGVAEAVFKESEKRNDPLPSEEDGGSSGDGS